MYQAIFIIESYLNSQFTELHGKTISSIWKHIPCIMYLMYSSYFFPLISLELFPSPFKAGKRQTFDGKYQGKMFQHLPLNGAFESRVPTFRQITEGLLLKNSLRTLRRREKIKTS